MNCGEDILVLVFILMFEQTISARLSGTEEAGYWLCMNKPADKKYEPCRYGKTEEAEEWKVKIPKEKVDEILSIIINLKFDSAPQSRFFRMDGPNSFNLILNNGSNKVSYRWQGTAPAGWEVLEEIVAVIRPYVRIDREYGYWK